jgi:hypothetical protein
MAQKVRLFFNRPEVSMGAKMSDDVALPLEFTEAAANK